jgi:hypothetical protein
MGFRFRSRMPGAPFAAEGLKKPHLRIFPNQRTPGAPSFALFAKGGIPRISIPTVAYPTLCKVRKGWATRPALISSCTYGFTLSGVAFAVGIRTLSSSATVGAICRISIKPRSR